MLNVTAPSVLYRMCGGSRSIALTGIIFGARERPFTDRSFTEKIVTPLSHSSHREVVPCGSVRQVLWLDRAEGCQPHKTGQRPTRRNLRFSAWLDEMADVGPIPFPSSQPTSLRWLHGRLCVEFPALRECAALRQPAQATCSSHPLMPAHQQASKGDGRHGAAHVAPCEMLQGACPARTDVALDPGQAVRALVRARGRFHRGAASGVFWSLSIHLFT